MKEKIFKSNVIEVKSLNEDKREITAIASKEIADRDGDIVRIEGINIKDYKKNPVVLFAHDSRSLPIAKTTKIWKDGKKLMVKMQFPEPEVSSMGDSIYKLVKGEYIKSLSIGFRPDWDDAVRLEKTQGWDFKSSNLYEISIVPVPANAAAVVQSKGIVKALQDEVVDDLEIKEIQLFLEDLIGDEPGEEVKEEVKEEKEVETDFTTENSEQTIETLAKEDDPYSWLWDFEPTETKEEDKDLYEMIYDVLGLNDSK